MPVRKARLGEVSMHQLGPSGSSQQEALEDDFEPKKECLEDLAMGQKVEPWETTFLGLHFYELTYIGFSRYPLLTHSHVWKSLHVVCGRSY